MRGDRERRAQTAGAWSYGHGRLHRETGEVEFEPLAHFTGDSWQGGPELPDAKTGWVHWKAGRGHPGHGDHAAIMRWEAPHKARVAVVIDADHRPVGYVTEDMLEGASGTVKVIANALPATVPVRADLRLVVSEMFAHDIMWLACVDDEGKFTGVVTQASVTRVLGETYRQDADAA